MSQPCKFGMKCTRQGCWFTHPAGHMLTSDDPNSSKMPAIPKPCRDGASCTRADCWFSHPDDRMEVSMVRPCRNGAQCTRADCCFTHPSGRVEVIHEVPCKYGVSCTRRDCRFAHPPERPNPNSEDAQRDRCSRSLFVGRLSTLPHAETTDNELLEYFSKFGEIVVAAVVRQNKDRLGKSRGFGLIEFRHKTSVDDAVRAPHPAWSIERRKYQPSGGTFLSSGDRSRRVAVDGELAHVHPHSIRFTHGRISFCFTDGKKVDETIEKCLTRKSRFEDAPMPHVVKDPANGCYYSLSNRRLYVARVLSTKGFKFGQNRDSDAIEVRICPFYNKHVQAQYKVSCRNQASGGRWVVPADLCGTCKKAHASKYLEEQVKPSFLADFQRHMRMAAERKQKNVSRHGWKGADGYASEDSCLSDYYSGGYSDGNDYGSDYGSSDGLN